MAQWLWAAILQVSLHPGGLLIVCGLESFSLETRRPWCACRREGLGMVW